MKCYFHPIEEAVASCTQCGMGMCNKCFELSEGSGLCPACLCEEIKAERVELKKAGKKRLLAATVWSLITLVVIAAAVVLLLFLHGKINSFFAPHGKIAFIVIACVVSSLVLAALMNSVIFACRAHAAQKKNESLEYKQRKLISVMRVANRYKAADATTEKKTKNKRK